MAYHWGVHMAHAHMPIDHPSSQTVLVTLAHLGCATLSQLHALCFPHAFAATVRLSVMTLMEAGLITHSHWRLSHGERCQVWTITTKGLDRLRNERPSLTQRHAPDLNRPSSPGEIDEWRVRIDVRTLVVGLILDAREQAVCARATITASVLYPAPIHIDQPPRPDATIAITWEAPTVQASDWLPWITTSGQTDDSQYLLYVERQGQQRTFERWLTHCMAGGQNGIPLLVLATPERYAEVTRLLPQEDQSSPIRFCVRNELSNGLLRAPWRDTTGQLCSLRSDMAERLT